MLRHTLLPAVAAAVLAFAVQPADADTCQFETASAGAYAGASAGKFEIDDFSFDIEQTLNIGSQSSGSGAGKVTFNPFTITKKIDSSTPALIRSALAGTAFREIRCSFYGSDRANASAPYLTAILSNATISKIKVDGSGQGVPREQVSFQYEKVEWQY
jgi:type VI secretion system secreted protein Hcp